MQQKAISPMPKTSFSVLNQFPVSLQSQAIHTNLYASSWFLTLFTTSLPIHLSCRIMDCFLLEGVEVIFRLALALLTIGKPNLLVYDMEGVIRVSRSAKLKGFIWEEYGVAENFN